MDDPAVAMFEVIIPDQANAGLSRRAIS
jgi:hypothetical protein